MMEEKDQAMTAGPWPKWVSFATTASALPATVAGTYALWRWNRRKLPAWGGLWGTLTTVSRRHICARCPYYGQYCSTLFGKVTPLMWPRDDRALTTRGFYWDIALAPALFLLPLPDAYRHSRRLFLAYLASWALFLGALYNLGCRRCPLAVCPFNPGRRRGGPPR